MRSHSAFGSACAPAAGGNHQAEGPCHSGTLQIVQRCHLMSFCKAYTVSVKRSGAAKIHLMSSWQGNHCVRSCRQRLWKLESLLCACEHSKKDWDQSSDY